MILRAERGIRQLLKRALWVISHRAREWHDRILTEQGSCYCEQVFGHTQGRN